MTNSGNFFSSLWRGGYGFFCLLWTAIKVKFNPQKESFYRKECSKKLIKLVTTQVKVFGKLDSSANILMGNHTSIMDIALMESLIPEKLIWVAKKEIGDYPIFGNLVTKSGMILVDRKDKKSTLKVFKRVKEVTQKGFKVVIFPEGTRNRKDPTKLLPFKKGVRIIPERLNLKVQPFVIVGFPTIFQGKKIVPGVVELHYLPSFYPSQKGKEWYTQMAQEMEKILQTRTPLLQ
ncbi:MAG: 1-acyl-sn-glycerol-3-phosphate acyltransferase [Epsilonproteobacteria bacterium]|jgi:1-acyl-sn-glycerol-3-phosphate acyltransferase|nr:1-acyl-sn-glycerol-3-phosphate acyltransferase [Campylobacterota bacterium]NPA88805.1 1-acyl-sn-glycerol-3-phosphate acyltransferase [Campylobacterota bacterium]